MTCVELLAKEHPEDIDPTSGEIEHCPFYYGYADRPVHCPQTNSSLCKSCWEREVIK